jgi:hypothetical protein
MCVATGEHLVTEIHIYNSLQDPEIHKIRYTVVVYLSKSHPPATKYLDLQENALLYRNAHFNIILSICHAVLTKKTLSFKNL